MARHIDWYDFRIINWECTKSLGRYWVNKDIRLIGYGFLWVGHCTILKGRRWLSHAMRQNTYFLYTRKLKIRFSLNRAPVWGIWVPNLFLWFLDTTWPKHVITLQKEWIDKTYFCQKYVTSLQNPRVFQAIGHTPRRMFILTYWHNLCCLLIIIRKI